MNLFQQSVKRSGRKVLVISAAFPPMRAGEADHAFHLCHHLSERGMDVHVLTTARQEPPPPLPFQVFPLMRDWSWLDLPRLAQFIRHCSPDAILLFYSDWIYKRHPMVTFAPVMSKLLLSRVPFVTQLEIHKTSIEASIFTRALLKALSICSGDHIDYVLGTLLAMSERLVVLSDFHRAALSQKHPGVHNKTAVVPPPPLMYLAPEMNGEARRRGRQALKLKADDFVIAYIGYIYSSKGVEVLFKAFRALKNRWPNLRLVMIGGDPTASNNRAYAKSFSRMIAGLGLKDEIIWTGPYDWDSDQASLYLRAADACVFPFNEGVRLNRSTLAAAAAHGLPIVTTRGQILESPFIDRANMLLCPPNDPESVAAAVESLITNPELRSQLGEGARQLAREWFSWDKAVDRTIELLGLPQPVSESGNQRVRGSKFEVEESLELSVESREHQGVRSSKCT